jgi:hypothetical protein
MTKLGISKGDIIVSTTLFVGVALKNEMETAASCYIDIQTMYNGEINLVL